jgi:ankyrin repeat protein
VQASTAARLKGKNGVHDAVQRGEVNVVQDYLIADASCVNCSFSKQKTWPPLHIAASEGHIEIVQLLLSCNAAIDARDFRYFYPTPALLIENALLMLCCVAPLTFAFDFLFLQQYDPAAHRRL